jgi:hypothetical protein
MRSIPISTFVDGISSVPGVSIHYTEHLEGYYIEWYIGPKGRCMVFMEDDEILEVDVQRNLAALGIEDLKEFFFPPM